MVAPLGSQSGMGGRIAYGGVLEVSHPVPGDSDVTAVAGSPSDAVAFGLSAMYADGRPDVVVSGTNYGQNTSRVTNHSGTVGAITTAIDRGIPAIAVSSEAASDYDPADSSAPDFADTASFVVEVLKELSETAPSCSHLTPEGLGLNINYPFGGLRGVKQAALDSIDPFPTTYTLRADGNYDISYTNATSGRADVDYEMLADGYATLTAIDGDLSTTKRNDGVTFIGSLVRRLN